MTGSYGLSIKLIKPMGEQAIVVYNIPDDVL